MKNKELKNVLLSCGLAVFASVFAIGVNAAFGVSAPTISPEDPGLVGPTFSNVTTAEDVAVGGEVTISSSQDANTSGNGALRIGDDPATRMLIDHNEILSLSKLYINNGGGQDVQIGVDDFPSDVEIFGNMIIDQILTIAGGIMRDGISDGTAATAGSVVVNDELDVGGAIKNTRTVDMITALGVEQPVTVDDDLSVTGFISTNGIAGGSYWEPFPIYYPQVISLLRVAYESAVGSNTGEIWVQDYLSDTPTSGGPVLELTPNQINERKGTITLQYWNNRDVQIGNTSSTTSNLDVNGAVTAERFGTYNTSVSGPIPVAVGGTASGSQSCASGEILISCAIYNVNTNVLMRYLYPGVGSNICYGGVRNNDSSVRYFNVWAHCLDPNA